MSNKCKKCNINFLMPQTIKAGFDTCATCRGVYDNRKIVFKEKIERKFCIKCQKELGTTTILSEKQYDTCSDCRQLEKLQNRKFCVECGGVLHHLTYQKGFDICRKCRKNKRYKCIENNCSNLTKTKNKRCRHCNAAKGNLIASKVNKGKPKIEIFIEKYGETKGYEEYRKFIETNIMIKLGNTHGKENLKLNHTPEANKKRRNSLSISLKGRLFDSEHKQKLRIIMIKKMEESSGQIIPSYNKKSIAIIEEYGKQHGYNFRHAETKGENDVVLGEYHIKELGYFLDGYDKENNTVIEYYEKGHCRRKEKDKIRKEEIVTFLKCNFIEIYENDWNLSEFFN